jgi:hypothetical protein
MKLLRMHEGVIAMSWNFKMAIDELHKIFTFLNLEIFNNILPEPAITIQSKGKRNALGWCSKNPIWVDSENKEQKYEINICAENANMKTTDIVEVMLHEMVHLYGDIHEIKTTSRNGSFHNKNYRDLALQFGLNVAKTKQYGYSETMLCEETIILVNNANFNQDAFILARINDEGNISKKKGSIKHVCPDCGNKARTTKEIPLICGKCMEQMDMEVDES